MTKTFRGLAFCILAAMISNHSSAQSVFEKINDPQLSDLDLTVDIVDAGSGYEKCFSCTFPPEWLAEQGIQNVAGEAEIDAQIFEIKLKMDESTGKSTKAVYPVQGGARFIAGLGVARSGGRRHAGVDLGARTGTPIVSAWPGRVLYAKWNGRGGYSVKITHPNGLSTYYAHLNSAPVVKAGQLVKAGQKLGGVGMSGNAQGTTPHLHFEVRRRSAILNPLNFISRS